MLRQFSTNQQTFFLVLLFVLLFVESAFFHNGSVFLAFLGVGLLYLGLRNFHRFGKAYFWTGIVLIGISVLSMWTLRLLIFGVAVYLLMRIWKGEEWQQEVPLRKENSEAVIRNKLFSAQSTPVEAYEWKDIHVQGFVGDLLIDATQTVLPKRTSLISIRQGLGKVRIIVPYEVPVRVFYSTLFGDAKIFNSPRQRILHSSVHVHDGYAEAEPGKAELIISLTTLMGDVEVIRR